MANLHHISDFGFISCNLLGIKRAGHTLKSKTFFDTVKFQPATSQQDIRKKAEAKEINIRYFDDGCVCVKFSLFYSSHF